MYNYYKAGSFNVICDVCGQLYKAESLQKRWDGLMVCKYDFETRHPQDFIRVPEERISVPYSRPGPEDEFISICYVWSSGAYADLGTADCMMADYAPLTYADLFKMKNG